MEHSARLHSVRPPLIYLSGMLARELVCPSVSPITGGAALAPPSRLYEFTSFDGGGGIIHDGGSFSFVAACVVVVVVAAAGG